jgi:DNA-directed RNA polymerase specialized sigma subunit
MERKNDTYMFYVIGTKKFISELQSILIKNINISNTTLRSEHPHDLIMSISYQGINNIISIRDYLYNNATMFLSRKWMIVQNLKYRYKGVEQLKSEYNQIVKCYCYDKLSIRTIALTHKVSDSVIKKILKMYYVIMHDKTIYTNKLNKDKIDTMYSLYMNKKSYKEIAIQLNISESTVNKYVTAHKWGQLKREK